MDVKLAHGVLRAVHYLVLLLMLAAIAYAAWISIEYWSGIGV